MALIDSDRLDAARKWIHKVFVEVGDTATLTTTNIKAAVDATDDWIEANQVSFNSALPLPFRTTATTAQKTLLFCYVALKRAGLI